VSASALTLLVAACDNPQDVLLETQHPEVIAPGDIQSAAGALGLYNGALGRLRSSLNGGNNNQETIWNFAGLMTDEIKSGDTFLERNNADQRATQSNDGVMGSTYSSVQTSRGRARDAINGLRQFAAGETVKIAEMYLVMGFMEMTLGQDFCNGIPLGETVAGVPQYTAPLTNDEVFATAISRFDSAITVLGSDATTAGNNIRNAALIAKGRALVNRGQFAAAATTVASVPTAFVYEITYSQTTQSNEWWQMSLSTKRYTVGDSFDVAGVIKNAIPFVTLKDPRVKVGAVGAGTKAFDTATPFVSFDNFQREDAIPLVSGVDARLIEAEAKLNGTVDVNGAYTILNTLRGAAQRISGSYTSPVMAALPVPASTTAAIDGFFREKALWQFGRGERLSDLRRLVRQYGRTQDNVFPSGPFHKNGTYGTNVAFPVPDTEKSNPNFKGCLDTKA